ncbi:hypothetical protein DTO013E5_6315 [Penicillium roqueforti]|uniref:uncharacterized protein n=1 Tax=Penicillium roqueforti TaxID=5082 RepID=UPI001909E4C1|nr:uncharacterized protein LCP9604111_5280 [Penicillium roqueforti]KAF9248530.1 hypothetical protein LCP9604111_5280 [Penicillium roqueforti]KAI2682108.1 hypothetical protein LCP963914a_6523 [Penicillium roqueforti]KAI2699242.1 hypothetical protein CBS147372_6489 [Penicillium roqueforti]KAI2714135.1 hypothetical protein CBS147318_6876 [Penicillium roqueforti]KAI2725052.1 hypothetical protein CBS147354_5369 [Penicillium roqueforti]
MVSKGILPWVASMLFSAATSEVLTCSDWLLGKDLDVIQPQHGNIDYLWNQLWRPLAIAQAEPFYDANVSDFDPIFDHLIKYNISDANTDEYVNAFLPTARDLISRAEEAENHRNTQIAGDLYTRAAVVLRIARYPSPIIPTKELAWRMQVDAYFKSAKYLDPPVSSVQINHTYAANGDGPTIPVAVRHVPDSESSAILHPVLLFVTGVDEFRPDFNPLTEWAVNQGYEVVVAEVPGTGDCPSNRSDPVAGDRLWNSVLNWMESQPQYDTGRIGVWSFSTGSYYGVRMAHTHSDRLHSVVAQGTPVHEAFSPDWISHNDDHEYAFRATPALTSKWGYESLDEFKQNSMQDYSLVLDGTLEQNSTQLLMINGIKDGFFPAEDTLIPLDFGQPKLVKLFPNETHMGGDPGFKLAQDWLVSVL